MTADEVMDQAAALLNDISRSLYSYTTQLPFLKIANQELEQILINCGAPIQSSKASDGALIAVAASTTPVVLAVPTGFLLPIKLWDRASSSTNNNDWNLLKELDFEPDVQPTVGLTYWAFRGGAVLLAPTSVARTVQMTYMRKLIAITASGSSIDAYLTKNILAARTAELCARHIGENENIADSIRDNEVKPSRDELERIYTLNSQSLPARRQRMFR